jgi:hypothetical protein
MESSTLSGTPPSTPQGPEAAEPTVPDASLTRRGFLRGAALPGTGLLGHDNERRDHAEHAVLALEKKGIDAICKALGVG